MNVPRAGTARGPGYGVSRAESDRGQDRQESCHVCPFPDGRAPLDQEEPG